MFLLLFKMHIIIQRVKKQLKHSIKFGQRCAYDPLFASVPELRVADHHPATPALSHWEGGELWQVFYGLVNQVPQSAG